MFKKDSVNIYSENMFQNDYENKINNDTNNIFNDDSSFDNDTNNIQLDFYYSDENEEYVSNEVRVGVIQLDYSEEEYHEELAPLDYSEEKEEEYHEELVALDYSEEEEEYHEELVPLDYSEEEEYHEELVPLDYSEEEEYHEELVALDYSEEKEENHEELVALDYSEEKEEKEEELVALDYSEEKEEKEEEYHEELVALDSYEEERIRIKYNDITNTIEEDDISLEESVIGDFIPNNLLRQKPQLENTDLDTIVTVTKSISSVLKKSQLYLPDKNVNNKKNSSKNETKHIKYEVESVYDNWEFVKVNDLNDNFDWKQYIENYNDLKKDGITTKEKAWKHWINYGQKEDRTYLPIIKTKHIINIDKSNKQEKNKSNNQETNFDWKQYIKNYDDLIQDGITTKEKAWNHWIKHGQFEGRTDVTLNDLDFNKNNVLNANQEVDIDFSWEQYIKNYDDLIKDGITTKEKAWNHWITHGKKEDRTYHSLIMNEEKFNWKQYIENYDDLLNGGIKTKEEAWNHWIKHGQNEGRSYENIYEEELKEYASLELKTCNHLKFKQKYDRYGFHYFGWKGVINQFVKYYMSLVNVKPYKYDIFFDEWIEKLLVWGNKIINQSYIKEIKDENYKVISFLHNPPFLQWNDPKYKQMISTEMIVNDSTQFNENIFNQISNINMNQNIIFLYVLSNIHKEYLWNTYPDYRKSIVSIHHPIDFNIDSEYCFDMNAFLNKKRIINIGWWLRNFKTFIDFNAPNEIQKMILVKNDFSRAFQNVIAKNNNLTNIKIINEISNDEYVSLFKQTCIFADIIDSSANNTILECIKFRTPIIVRRTPASEEYLGINYPLFFNDLEDLEVLSEESFLLDLIYESHIYLKNLNTQKISLETFNNKIVYDLNKLSLVNYHAKLTWVCFVSETSQYYLDNLLDNFIKQNSLEQIYLQLFVTANNTDYIIDIISKYASFTNIKYTLLNSKSDFISFNSQIEISIKHINTPYLVYTDCKNTFDANYSILFIDYLDKSPNCDIAFSSYRIFKEFEDSYQQVTYKNEMLVFLKDKDTLSSVVNSGIVWRKDIYKFISSVNINNTYLENFWVTCIENNMNMICISENPLYIINQ